MSGTQQVLAARPSRSVQSTAPAARAPPPARLGFRLGDLLCRAPCGGVPRLCRVSLRPCAMDGPASPRFTPTWSQIGP